MYSLYSPYISQKYEAVKLGLLAILVIIGLAYFSLNRFSIESVTKDGETISLPYKNFLGRNLKIHFNLELYSPVQQVVRVNVVADDWVETITVNGVAAKKLINYPRTRTTYQDIDYGDVYALNLDRGTNKIFVRTFNKGGNATLMFKQKFSVYEYILAFLTLILPFIFFVFYFVRFILDNGFWVYQRMAQIPLAVHIIWVAIILRTVYFYDMGYISFQHDYRGHIEFIQFFANYFTIPLPHKGWEYPQQPLYYVFTGVIYKICSMFEMEERPSLKVIGTVTSLLSSIALIYAYRLIRLLTKDKIVHNLVIAFLALTPSLIYMSARTNNDPWASSLAIISLFYIIASFKHDFQKYFWPAVIWSAMLFLTKISSLGIQLLFIFCLLTLYFKHKDKAIKPMFHYAWVGALVLTYTMFRAYYPAAETFVFVNGGIWPGQDLRPLNANYFLSFNFIDLLEQGQSHIREADTDRIKYSFFSYQYGTMLFGQFDYQYWRERNYMLTINMQLIMLLALIVPLGWITALFLKKTLMEKFLATVAIVSFILVLKFIFDYPTMSNTDFRYYAAIQFILAYFFAIGLRAVMRLHKYVKKILVFAAGALFLLEAFFIVNLISV